MQQIERSVIGADVPDYVDAATALHRLADEFRSADEDVTGTAHAFVYRLEGAAAALEAIGCREATHLAMLRPPSPT
jgi:hypothetical protein